MPVDQAQSWHLCSRETHNHAQCSSQTLDRQYPCSGALYCFTAVLEVVGNRRWLATPMADVLVLRTGAAHGYCVGLLTPAILAGALAVRSTCGTQYPVWRGGNRCCDGSYDAANGIRISARLY